MKMGVRAGALALASGLAAPALAAPSSDYLVPHVKAGDVLPTVFSRTISVRGAGFEEIVQRVGGTATDTITDATPDRITENETARYDGRPDSSAEAQWRDHMRTNCYGGTCAPYNQTSASLFPTLLWGEAPTDISVGTAWKVAVTAPWEIGPAGEENVRVARIDAANHIVTLERRGQGNGAWDGYDIKRTVAITANGKPLAVHVIPGDAHWEGLTVVREGVILSDEIMVHQDVTLRADSGESFAATRRSYTLLNAAPQDSVMP